MQHHHKPSVRFEIVVLDLLKLIIRRLDNMALKLDDLIEAVKADVEADTSAIVLINGIADKISEAVAEAVANATMDPAAQAQIDALTAQIKESSAALGAAITENTPSAPPVEPAPPVEEPPVEPPVEEPPVEEPPVEEPPVEEPPHVEHFEKKP